MKLDLVPFTPNTVIDIGCGTGSWYLDARKQWPKAHFILIDANPECQPALEFLGVDYTIAVLSDKEKKVMFYTRKGSPACTGASYYREQTEFYSDDNILPNEVETLMLDQVVWGDDLRGDILIKLDTQGSELDILKGGMNVLSKAKAVITEVSFVEYNKGAPTYLEVDQFMLANGFLKSVVLGSIIHPLKPELVIQDDILYLRQ